MKLLLVDDEPGIREGLAALLRRKGHEVITAANCRDARECLDTRDMDLVLTDWRLSDGIAEEFVVRATCPVVAMSGHPEEVEGHQAIRQVLTKPVAPSRLTEVIASFAQASTPAAAAIPKDVALLVASARGELGSGLELEDDGVFVTVRAPLADAEALARLRQLGGDLRVLRQVGVTLIELRWCRDGRPAPDMIVAQPEGAWPEVAEYAVDFDDTGVTGPAFGACLDRYLEQRRRGRTVHFLNVPDSLLSWATDQGRTDDMPMRSAGGPRLPAVLADLWS